MCAPFAERRLEGELMDDPALGEAEHLRALRGLARINAVSRTAAALWPTIARVAAAQPGRPLRLLDVACGGGDVAIKLAERARRRGVEVDISGCDISNVALRFASARAAAKGVPVRFFQLNVLTGAIPEHYDMVMTTLFLHHLSDEEIVTVLARLSRHCDHLLVSDLLRGPLGYALAWAGTHLLSASPIVHVDGMRSLRAALSLPEVLSLVAEAGLSGARIRRSWPRRFLLHWARAEAGSEASAHAV